MEGNGGKGGDPATLGDVLYAGNGGTLIPENDWGRLIQSVAAGDRLALHELFDRTYRLVFTLIVRLTQSREIAEELTLDVFHDVWRDASKYDAAEGTVLGWIMNQARSRAMGRLRFTIDADEISEFLEKGRTLRSVLSMLSPEERDAIESAYFSGSTYAEVAAQFEQPLGTITTRIHSGLGKLRQALVDTGILDSASEKVPRDCSDRVTAYVLHALPASEATEAEAHIFACSDCQQELKVLRPVVNSFVCWPIDVLRTSASLRTRLAWRIAAETGSKSVIPETPPWLEPKWEAVAPGISCKLLATDTDNDRVSMLVRLTPGGSYPSHVHAGLEELHLLHGALWIDDRELHPGDYNRAEPGTSDKRVWSETGCTCVLITSTRDALVLD
jgi:RNA polymerase sigma factor (sigma-70 family)